jgi:probable rRNA maturation factor
VSSTPAAETLNLDLRFRVRRRSGARLDRPALRAACRAVLTNEAIGGDVMLTLTFVDGAEIRAINAEHRGIDRVTDVLSFSLVEPVDDAPVEFALPDGEPRELGDVVICYPRAIEQADEYGHSVEREVSYLTVHGLLHILGYDHEVPAEQAEMRAREEAALAVVGLTRPGQD